MRKSGPTRAPSGWSVFSPLVDLPLQDSRPLPRLKFLVRILALAERQKMLVSVLGWFDLVQLIQYDGTQEPVARKFLPFPGGLLKGGERRRQIARHVKHAAGKGENFAGNWF